MLASNGSAVNTEEEAVKRCVRMSVYGEGCSVISQQQPSNEPRCVCTCTSFVYALAGL